MCQLCNKIGLKIVHHFLIRSKVKPDPIGMHLSTFHHVSCKLHVITSRFDWFSVFSVLFFMIIGLSCYKTLVLVFQHLYNTIYQYSDMPTRLFRTNFYRYLVVLSRYQVYFGNYLLDKWNMHEKSLILSWKASMLELHIYSFEH